MNSQNSKQHNEIISKAQKNENNDFKLLKEKYNEYYSVKTDCLIEQLTHYGIISRNNDYQTIQQLKNKLRQQILNDE